MNSILLRIARTRKTSTIFLALSLVSSIQPELAKETAVSRGKNLFAKATCEGCHPGGENLLHPSKVLKGQNFASRYKNDADIAKVIRSGIRDTGMPSFTREQLSDAEVKDIIAYIRSLTAPPPAPTGSKGPKSSGRPSKANAPTKKLHP